VWQDNLNNKTALGLDIDQYVINKNKEVKPNQDINMAAIYNVGKSS